MSRRAEVTLFYIPESTYEESRNSIARVHRPYQYNAIHPVPMTCSKMTSHNTTHRVANDCHIVLDVQCVQ